MKDEKEHIEIVALVAKSLADALSPAEQIRVDEWLAASEENRTLFAQLKKAWEISDEDFGWRPNAAETEAAWQNVKRKIAAPAEAKVFKMPRYWAVAASLALLISAVLWFKPFNQKAEFLVAATGEIADTVQLADGSQVILNPYSRLKYPAAFEAEERNVSLEGSAFFEVQGDANRPFKISAATSIIEVVGTKFSVNQSNDSVFVAVVEGTVKLYNDSENAEKISISRGQSAYSTKAKAPVFVDDVNEKFIVNDVFFEAVAMGEVLTALEEIYGVQIDVANPEFLECSFSTKLTAATLEEVLESIQLVFEVEVVQNGNRIIITGKGC